MYVLQCPEWVRLLYRKKEQVTRKSQVCDLKIRTLDDVDENGYLSRRCSKFAWAGTLQGI